MADEKRTVAVDEAHEGTNPSEERFILFGLLGFTGLIGLFIFFVAIIGGGID